MKSFLVAILLYPDVQKKAQAELDSVIGRERLPTLEDRPNLPFIDAVCKEVLRWRPATPLGTFPEWHLISCILCRWQPYHMQSQKMMSMQAFSYQRVSRVS